MVKKQYKELNDFVNLFETSKGLADCHLLIGITHLCQFGTEDLRKYFIKIQFLLQVGFLQNAIIHDTIKGL